MGHHGTTQIWVQILARQSLLFLLVGHLSCLRLNFLNYSEESENLQMESSWLSA